MEHPREIPETPRTVVTRDSLKLPVAPFPREEFRASDSELVRPWSTAEWVAVATGDAAVQLPDGTRWELLEVHQIYVNATDAEDGTGVSTDGLEAIRGVSDMSSVGHDSASVRGLGSVLDVPRPPAVRLVEQMTPWVRRLTVGSPPTRPDRPGHAGPTRLLARVAAPVP
jgi:hypothetical protein